METLLKILGGILLAAIIFIIYVLLGGYIVYKFWEWFVLPIFTTLPVITLIQGIGIGMFISIFGEHNPVILKDEYKDESSEYITLFKPFITLLIGWLIHIIFF